MNSQYVHFRHQRKYPEANENEKDNDICELGLSNQNIAEAK